ncbi:MAG TPA: hypothetical protein VF771_18035, partial [Longimicrobiaceae bacterium]
GITNVIREDPTRRGLLYAGTEREVYVSFDDGGHWQSLRLNMPASSIRDLVVHDQDLVVGTHGRSFWILDDVTPLRQVDARTEGSAAVLVRPHDAVRARWNTWTDTPLPPDEPMGQNPPDGAVIDYWLGRASSQPVTLEIVDGAGKVVRRYTSTDSVPPVRTEGNVPWYWVRPPQRLSGEAGMHRFVWDLHHEPPAVLEREYPISATPHDTPKEPRGPWALPGAYTVRLTVDGRAYTQPLVVRMDPRVRTLTPALAQQLATAQRIADGLRRDYEALSQLRGVRTQLGALKGKGSAELQTGVATFDQRAAALEEGAEQPSAAGNTPMALVKLNGDLATLYALVESADVAPTSQALAAVEQRLQALDASLAAWRTLREQNLEELNRQLRAAGLAPIAVRAQPERDDPDHAVEDEDEP